MAKITIIFGVLLILLGVIGFVATGSSHMTALIPAAFGVLLAALGAVAQAKPNLRMHIMHAAVLVGLLGFFGTIPGVIKLIKWAGGTAPTAGREAAAVAQSVMAVLMVVFVAMCVRSFIEARKNRLAGKSV
jgi:hypothetical protein